MARALDRVVVELTLPERAAVVCADIVDRAPLAVLGVPDAQRPALQLDDPDGAGLDVADASNRGEPCGLFQSGNAASASSVPMRVARAASTCSRIVSSPICRTTC